MRKKVNHQQSPPLNKPIAKKAEIKNQSSAMSSQYYFLTAILFFVFCIYSNSLRNEILTFDDNEYFTKYPEVLHLSWKSVCTYFTNYYVIMYQPLPVLSFALHYYFSAFNTFPIHLINLLFHLANVLLVYQFIKLLTHNQTAALLIALLFGIHPMNVEAVSWISARSSGMYTFFYLFALIYYLKYIRENFQLKHLIITGVFFILSLFSKAQAVTLPVVMLLIDYFFERKISSPKIIIDKIPFLILSIAFGLITLHDADTMSNITKGIVRFTPIEMFFIVSHSIVFYLFKFILPVNLCSIYIYPQLNDGMLPWSYYLSAIILIGIGIAVYLLRKNKSILFGAGLFICTVAINIQLIPSRLFEVTDRYAYFPYLGLFLIVFFCLNQWKEKNSFIFDKYKPSLIALLFIYGIFFSYSVYSRNAVWQNDETLMTDIITKNPPSEYIRRAYGNRGMYYKNQNRLPEAIVDFTETIKLKHDEPIAYFNRGLTNFMMNNNANALSDFDSAVAFNLIRSDLFSSRAQLRLLSNDTVGAIADCIKSIQLDSNFVDAYNTLATINFNQKQLDLCEQNLTTAIRHKPDFAIAYKNRGQVYLQIGKKEEACNDLQQAINLGNQEAVQLQLQYCK